MAFKMVAKQMLADVQERLVYRTSVYNRSDILCYSPAPRGLAYPERKRTTLAISVASASSIISDNPAKTKADGQLLRENISSRVSRSHPSRSTASARRNRLPWILERF